MAKKRFGQLSFEDKLGLIPAERMQEEGKSLNKIAKEEFRKQKKAGTLDKSLEPKPQPNPAEFQQYGDNTPQKVNVSTTVSTPVPKLNEKGEMGWTSSTFEAGSNRPSDVYQKLADDNVNKAIQDLAMKNKTAEDASKSIPFIQNNTTPENEIKNKIDATELAAKNEAINTGDTSVYNDIKASADESRKAAANANDALAQASAGAANSAIKKIVEFTNIQDQNPNASTQITKNDLFQAQDELDNALNSGDPNAYQYADVLNRFLSNPNVRYSEPAIEKLGLTEYYPDMGSNIRVGEYSGSIVGKNDIYTAQGGVLPMAIYDARSRALEQAAKERAKNKEKLLEYIDIKAAYPYKQQFNDATVELLNKYGEAVNWDFNKLNPLNSTAGMKFYKDKQKLTALGNTTLELEKQVNKLFEAEKDEKMYISPEQRALMNRFINGQYDIKTLMNNPDKMKEFYDIANKAKAYDNAHYYVKNAAKELAAHLDENPIQIKGDLSDPKVASDIDELTHKSSNMSYDRYVSGLMKYVDDDRVKNLVDAIHSQHNLGIGGNEQQQKEALMKMALAYLPRQVQVKQDMQANDNYEIWKAKQDFAREDERNKTLFTTISNNATNPIFKEQLLNQASNTNLSPADRIKNVDKVVAEGLGGRVIPGEKYMTYSITPKAKSSAATVSSLADAYSDASKKKEALNYLNTIPQYKKLTEEQKKNSMVKTIPLEEKIEYGHIGDDNSWRRLEKSRAVSDPNSLGTAKLASRTKYAVVLEYQDEVTDGYGNIKFVPKKIELPAAEKIIPLDNYQSIATKDAEYSNLQGQYTKGSDQGITTDIKQVNQNVTTGGNSWD